MRIIRKMLLLVLLVLAAFYLLEKYHLEPDEAISKIGKYIQEKKSEIQTKPVPEKKLLSERFKGDLFHWMGQSEKKLQKVMGSPLRKDISAYGYTWWVYTDQKEQYIQFGVEDGTIKTVFATGKELSTNPIQIGDSYETVDKTLTFNDEVLYSKGVASYNFRLSQEDLQMRPIAKITEDVYVQCYFDTFTNQLSAIRILTGEVLLKHRPYELQYRGNLPTPPDLSDKTWTKVEKGMQQQILDITNVMRNYYKKPSVKWDGQVSKVAFLHSKDMAENNYFSHYGLNGEGLKERLAQQKIYYFSAGENIAAQYPDAPAAMEGWLNSEGHREALLNEEYTHLGVGVYRLYYTQNFLSKPF